MMNGCGGADMVVVWVMMAASVVVVTVMVALMW